MSSVKSGTYCKCGACGYEGYAYGTLSSSGGSAAWCQRCGINNKLIEIMNVPNHLKDLRYEPNKRSRLKQKRNLIGLFLLLLLLPFALAALYLLTEWTGFYDWIDSVFESPWVKLVFTLSLVAIPGIIYIWKKLFQ